MKSLATIRIGALAIFAAVVACPQPTFEVATIKHTPPDWGAGRWIRMTSAHQLTAKNHALRTLLAAAFSLTPAAVSGGPSWVDSDRYDIVAEVPDRFTSGPPNYDEQMSMLRALLLDRFHLTTHRENKEFPVYTLTIAKGGAKLRGSTIAPGADPKTIPACMGAPNPRVTDPTCLAPLTFIAFPDAVRLPARGTTMASLAEVLQRAVFDRAVIDKTGLTGRYDFDLEFAPDESQSGDSKPRIFEALQQQLGLRLEATRGPVNTLVIDQVERPSEN
jgi:uncharacterized protein (TIGR03435 family)